MTIPIHNKITSVQDYKVLRVIDMLGRSSLTVLNKNLKDKKDK